MTWREGYARPLLVVTCSEIDFDIILKYIINQRIMKIFSHFHDELLAILSHFLDELGYVFQFCQQ